LTTPRPPWAPAFAAGAASNDDSGARTAQGPRPPRPISALPLDDAPQSLADEDLVDLSAEGDPAAARDANRTARGRREGSALSVPDSVPPAADDDADSAARQHLGEEDALPENERVFGPFTLLRRLAFGGMGEVFLARRDAQLPAGLGPAPSRLIVVKRILAHMRRDEEQRRGFVEEARLQTLLRSPQIVQIQDVGEIDGQVYLAMEHVHGPSWRALIDRCRRNKQHIPLGYVVDMMVQAAEGLAYAHNLIDAHSGLPLRVVHRDINPHNVLVTFDGDVKVIDFGIAKSDLSLQHTATGTIKGKFAYMSPEQSAAEPLDARSDLFALGICFYELLTLRNPFKRSNVVLSLEAIQRTMPPSPSASRPAAALLDPVVERMLRKNPDDRFADCAEVTDALRFLLQDGIIPEPQQPLSTWLRGLFGPELESHRRILELTGTVVDVVSAPSRPPLPHSSSAVRALPRAAADPTVPTAPAPARAALEPDVPAPERDGATGPTGALPAQPRSPPAFVLGAVTALVGVVAVVGVGIALRPPPAPLPVRLAAPLVAAGANDATTTPGDAGVAPRAPDAGPPVVDSGDVAVADAGVLSGAVGVVSVVADVGVDVTGPDGAGTPTTRPTKPTRPVNANAGNIVARIAMAADGFVVKGPRTLGSKGATVLVVDDRQAPFKLRLKVRSADGSARIAVDSEPWAIVRVDQVGRGRTPVDNIAVPYGKKTLLSLQNPAGAAMEISLTLTPQR